MTPFPYDPISLTRKGQADVQKDYDIASKNYGDALVALMNCQS
jgi:hypothetical protein